MSKQARLNVLLSIGQRGVGEAEQAVRSHFSSSIENG